MRTLAENDLVDEYRLMVFPVLLGGGKRPFDDLSDSSWSAQGSGLE